jgi:hypothetical protein
MKSIRTTMPILLLAALSFAAQAFAQESGTAAADDPFSVDFFGEDAATDKAASGDTAAGSGLVEEAPESSSTVTPGKEFLKTESVKIGGSFTGRAGASWTSDNPWTDGGLDDYSLITKAIGYLYFDARPLEDFRVFGKFKTSWPFSTTETVYTSATTTDSLTLPNISVYELFADFSWNDAAYFRFGKQTINWGVGYFFSPADVFNLESIDMLDPTAQREGPIALRAMFPIQGTQTNIWAYAVWPSDEDDPKPEDLAFAAKAEFLVANAWEIGLGGYYRYDKAPRAMLTASGSIRKVSVFGEAMASWGSDKTYVTKVNSITDYDTATYDEGLYFSGTVGFLYTDSDTDLTIAAQYYYNGDGYSESDRTNLISEARSVLGSGSTGTSSLQALIANSSRHYAAATVSKEFFNEKFTTSLTAIASLSDFSGLVVPTLTWEFFDYLKVSVFSYLVFGGDNDEYAILFNGDACTLGFYLTLGTGSF